MLSRPEGQDGIQLLSLSAVVAVLVRPRLYYDAVVALVRLARRGWWRRWPPVPTPDPAYIDWRTQTAYGGDASRLQRQAGDDLVAYLDFCRNLRRSSSS